MRVNEPITDREIVMEDGVLLVSRTDTGGRITFVNKAFVDISGYTEAELIGAPHNLIRHPHMPKEAFADLWATIKDGRPWEGMVKNRTKSGDFYWVRANVTPVIEDGKVSHPIKGAMLIGNGPDAMHRVSMVGNDMKLDTGIGMCGKAGQGVPVGVGQPHLRMDAMTLGGTQA